VRGTINHDAKINKCQNNLYRWNEMKNVWLRHAEYARIRTSPNHDVDDVLRTSGFVDCGVCVYRSLSSCRRACFLFYNRGIRATSLHLATPSKVPGVVMYRAASSATKSGGIGTWSLISNLP